VIRTLGRCEILVHGRILPNDEWRDPKDLELLLALAFATRLVQAGVVLYKVQLLLGHKSVASPISR
jgi:hypothetical protein